MANNNIKFEIRGYRVIPSNTNLPDTTEYTVYSVEKEYTVVIEYIYDHDWACEKHVRVYGDDAPLALYDWAEAQLS